MLNMTSNWVIAMTSIEDYIKFMLSKPNSKITSENGDCTSIEIKHFGNSHLPGDYHVGTNRYNVFADGRVMVEHRDEVEGTDFRHCRNYLLKNVTIEDSKVHVHQLGWK